MAICQWGRQREGRVKGYIPTPHYENPLIALLYAVKLHLLTYLKAWCTLWLWFYQKNTNCLCILRNICKQTVECSRFLICLKIIFLNPPLPLLENPVRSLNCFQCKFENLFSSNKWFGCEKLNNLRWGIFRNFPLGLCRREGS